jgi:hypothetical protein
MGAQVEQPLHTHAHDRQGGSERLWQRVVLSGRGRHGVLVRLLDRCLRHAAAGTANGRRQCMGYVCKQQPCSGLLNACKGASAEGCVHNDAATAWLRVASSQHHGGSTEVAEVCPQMAARAVGRGGAA